MSICSRRKHVLREMMEDDYKLPTAGQQIVRVVRSCGNNLHEVETAEEEGANFLVSMPTKFRRMMWIKRGDYVLVEPIAEGDKVKAEICRILTPVHILEYDKAGVWPENFQSAVVRHSRNTWKDLNEELDDDAEFNEKYFLIKPNCNRQVIERPSSDSDDDDEEEEEEEEEDDDEDNTEEEEEEEEEEIKENPENEADNREEEAQD